jgi:type IV secretion system protein VirB5
LTAVRTVTPDIALEKHNIFQAYAYVKDADPAKATLNEWFNGTPGTDPISRSSKELVDVDVGSILKLSDTSWQVDWVETSRMPDGTVFSTKRLRAVINLYVDDKGSLPEQTIRLNPLGLYIKNFHWTELDSTGT